MRRAVRTEVRQSALNMRTTETLRRHLEAEAAKSGRTLSHEIEYRLERSFTEDGTYTTSTNAAILRDLASVFQLVGFDRNKGANRLSRKLLLAIIERIVTAHLPDAPAKPKGILNTQPNKADDVVKMSDDEFDRLRTYCLKLTDTIIESSALPELPAVLVPREQAPFGFHSDLSRPESLIGLVQGRPASLNELAKKATDPKE